MPTNGELEKSLWDDADELRAISDCDSTLFQSLPDVKGNGGRQHLAIVIDSIKLRFENGSK